MSDIERRSDRLATLRDRVERLPGYEGELGTRIEAATARLRMARNCNLPKRAISMLDVAARILGLDPATRDTLFCGAGSKWFEDLGAMPKRAILDALNRTMAGTVAAGIWKPPAATRQDR